VDIENSMLIKGGKELIESILSFIDTLVIKNEQEADINETDESFYHYEKYIKSISNITTFADHTFNISDLPENLSQYGSVEILDNELRNGNPIVVSFINQLRIDFIGSYIDLNPYYAMLSGKPLSTDQYINIIDRDNPALKLIDVTNIINTYDVYDISKGPLTLYDIRKSSFPNFYSYLYDINNGVSIIETVYDIHDTLLLHNVKYSNKPNTYTAIYIDGIIDDIIRISKFEYLKYIKYNLDIRTLRETKHFEILWYNSLILDTYTLNSFFTCYNSVKTYILSTKYIKNFEEMYEHYSNIELLIILFGTFQRLCNSFIDRYSVRNYTDKEIYDILDSNNLSQLKTVNMDILRRVVENLDTLLSYRGTEYVLPILLETASKDNLLSIQRYDLIKKFKTDELGNSILSTSNGLYNDNVDLAFVDKTIHSSGDDKISSRSDSQIFDYESFVLKDKSWGNSGKYDTEAGKLEAIRKIKRDILRIEFNRLSTKYIGVMGTVNIVSDSNLILSKIGLLLQFHGGFGELTNTYQYNGIHMKLLHMITIAMCCKRYIENIDKNIPYIERDNITSDYYTYIGLMKLNSVPISNTLEILLDLEFTPHYSNISKYGEMGYSKVNNIKVKDVLSENDIRDIIIYFDNTNNTLDYIIKQFEVNYNRYNDILYNSAISGDYNTAMAWKTILKYFTTDIVVDDYFNIPTYTEFFTSEGDDLLIYFENNIKNATRDELITIFKQVIKKFGDELSIILGEDDNKLDHSSESKITSDLNNLITTFASIYVEMRDVVINFNFSDVPFNRIQLLDRATICHINDHKELFHIGDYNEILHSSIFKDDFLIKEIVIQEYEDKISDEFIITDENVLAHNNEERSKFLISDYNHIEHEQNDSESFGIYDVCVIEDM